MRVIVFDFDDTLFVKREGEGSEKIAKTVDNLLGIAMSYGKVYIITNANRVWINHCATNFLNSSENFLKIVNRPDGVFCVADSEISKKYHYYFWKFYAFQEVLGRYFMDGQNHELIAFGDMPHDRAAVIGIKRKYPKVTVKSILMASSPATSADDLANQQFYIFNTFGKTVAYTGDIDVRILRNS